MSAEDDLINLGVCIKQQAERVGVEHEGVPLEGVVVRIANAASEAGWDERCHVCSGELDYVSGRDGQGCYPHCWTCWYKEHPQDQIREYKEGKR